MAGVVWDVQLNARHTTTRATSGIGTKLTSLDVRDWSAFEAKAEVP
jgi:hypothetical protein